MNVEDLILRDLLEAWMNEDVAMDTETTPISIHLDRISKRLGWSSKDLEFATLKLSHIGDDCLPYLAKKTLFKLGVPVLLVQELRRELKVDKKAPFRLPIVGDLAALTLGKTGVGSLGRVQRRHAGCTYEYDRLCPHKLADLTGVVILLYVKILNTCIG